jgi:hypothetical protein
VSSSARPWLGALRIRSSPPLPVQVLVGPRGKVYRIVEGAVEDPDFAQVAALVSQR